MPRYYFDFLEEGDFLDEGGLLADDEGRELSDTHAVQVEAARSLIDMAGDSLLESAVASIDRITIQVRDDAGCSVQV